MDCLTYVVVAVASESVLCSTPPQAADIPVIIAHRGACGYLPEHTLEAKAMAYAMGVDYVEQDVVLTKDDVPIVVHDIHLDTVTDVAKRYPGRARADGRYYAVDFALEEIKRLRATERLDAQSGTAVFAKRFPAGKSDFSIPTLAEEIELVQGLNRSTGRDVGIYPEIKSPAWHRKEGKDISKVVLDILEQYGYTDGNCRCFLQCFDDGELKRIRFDLGAKLKLIQLIGENDWNEAATDYDALQTIEGLREVAKYAEGIGPWIGQVVTGRDAQGRLCATPLVQNAHSLGLKVHPYTFRADELPDHANTFEELLKQFLVKIGVDGIFTDFPDRAVSFRDRTFRVQR